MSFKQPIAVAAPVTTSRSKRSMLPSREPATPAHPESDSNQLRRAKRPDAFDNVSEALRRVLTPAACESCRKPLPSLYQNRTRVYQNSLKPYVYSISGGFSA